MTKSFYRLAPLTPQSTLQHEFEDNINAYIDNRYNFSFSDPNRVAWYDPRVGGLRKEMETRNAFFNAHFGDLQSREAFEKFRAGIIQETEERRAKAIEKMDEQARIKRELEEAQKTRQLTESEKKDLKKATLVVNNREVTLKHLQAVIDRVKVADDFVALAIQTNNYNIEATTLGINRLRTIDGDEEKGNRAQVRWAMEEFERVSRNRYNTSQGLSLALINGSRIPEATVDHISDLHQKLIDGLDTYRKYVLSRNGMADALTSMVSAESIERENLGEAYRNVMEHYHEAQGLCQAYQDSIDALINSPMYPVMQAYFTEQAEKEAEKARRRGDTEGAQKADLLASYWADGKDPDSIFLFLKKNNHFKQTDFTDLYRQSLTSHVAGEIRPTLEKLEILQQKYQFLAQKANEFNQARQEYEKQQIAQNGQATETLVDYLTGTEAYQKVDKDSPIQLNLDFGVSQKDAGRLTDVAGLMLQKGTIPRGMYEGIKELAVFGTSVLAFNFCCKIPGYGFVIGFPVAGAVGATTEKTIESAKEAFATHPYTASTYQAIREGIIDNTEFLSNWKNSDDMKYLETVLKNQDDAIKKYEKDIETLQKSPEYNEQAMLEYAYRHATRNQRDVLEIVMQAKELEQMKKEDSEAYKKLFDEHQVAAKESTKRIAELEAKLEKDQNNQQLKNELDKLTLDRMTIQEKDVLFQAVETQRFFDIATKACSQHLGSEISKNLSGIEDFLSERNYRTGESVMLNNVYLAMADKTAAQREYENWQLLLNAWQRGGRQQIGNMSGNDYEHRTLDDILYPEISDESIFDADTSTEDTSDIDIFDADTLDSDTIIGTSTESAYSNTTPTSTTTPMATPAVTPVTPTTPTTNNRVANPIDGNTVEMDTTQEDDDDMSILDLAYDDIQSTSTTTTSTLSTPENVVEPAKEDTIKEEEEEEDDDDEYDMSILDLAYDTTFTTSSTLRNSVAENNTAHNTVAMSSLYMNAQRIDLSDNDDALSRTGNTKQNA